MIALIQKLISSKGFRYGLIIISVGIFLFIVEVGISKFTFKKDKDGTITFDKEKLYNKKVGIK